MSPASRTACASKLAPAFAGCTILSAASPAEPAIKPDVIVWYILASLHRRQREPTAPLCRLHKPSAALPAGPTPDVLVWYVLTPAQSRQRLQTALLYSVCAPAAASVPARHVYSQTVN